MCRERKSASKSLRRWTAPRRRACHRGKELYRHKAQSYPTVQSTACSELLTASGKERPEKNASCCDPDKDPTGQQARGQRSEVRDQRSVRSDLLVAVVRKRRKRRK